MGTVPGNSTDNCRRTKVSENALTRIQQASKSRRTKSYHASRNHHLKKPQWRTPKMSTQEPGATKPAKTFDSAYSFSFAIAIGLILFIAGLVVSLTLGGGTSLGLIIGIPLLVAGLVVPLIMMRDQFKQSDVAGP